jgi:cation/acetate symporter
MRWTQIQLARHQINGCCQHAGCLDLLSHPADGWRGVLVEPLLGIPHSWGVLMVGAIVITIVATAGMASTTYVQFLKGSLLIVFSTVLVGAVLIRGLSTSLIRAARFPSMNTRSSKPRKRTGIKLQSDEAWSVLEQVDVKGGLTFVKLNKDGKETWWSI